MFAPRTRSQNVPKSARNLNTSPRGYQWKFGRAAGCILVYAIQATKAKTATRRTNSHTDDFMKFLSNAVWGMRNHDRPPTLYPVLIASTSKSSSE